MGTRTENVSDRAVAVEISALLTFDPSFFPPFLGGKKTSERVTSFLGGLRSTFWRTNPRLAATLFFFEPLRGVKCIGSRVPGCTLCLVPFSFRAGSQVFIRCERGTNGTQRSCLVASEEREGGERPFMVDRGKKWDVDEGLQGHFRTTVGQGAPAGFRERKLRRAEWKCGGKSSDDESEVCWRDGNSKEVFNSPAVRWCCSFRLETKMNLVSREIRLWFAHALRSRDPKCVPRHYSRFREHNSWDCSAKTVVTCLKFCHCRKLSMWNAEANPPNNAHADHIRKWWRVTLFVCFENGKM